MKTTRIGIQLLLPLALLLTSCQAKPTPTAGNPPVPDQLGTNSQSGSGQPDDSVVKSVVDGYLTAFKNQDWEKAFQFVQSPFQGCLYYTLEFASLDNFEATTKNTMQSRGGTLSSWEYQSINWNYTQAQGGGFYTAKVEVFRYWTSGYKELDSIYLGSCVPGSSPYRIGSIYQESY
jgi:hypothetical protein